MVDAFDPDLLNGFVTQDQLDLSQEPQDTKIAELETREDDLEAREQAEEAAREAGDDALQTQIDSIVSTGGGVQYLGELKDVDLSGTRGSFALENPTDWMHYMQTKPGEGEFGDEAATCFLMKRPGRMKTLLRCLTASSLGSS